MMMKLVTVDGTDAAAACNADTNDAADARKDDTKETAVTVSIQIESI